MVTDWLPAPKLLTGLPVCKAGCHKKPGTPEPPVQAMFPVPSKDPLHFGFVTVKVVDSGAGSKIVTFVVAVQLFASVTVTE